ncbi:hypothetical protein GIB67_023621 [Kingdonia uniflora]|uniref:Uncharacterized protein n=1 Tax=Kingdonia uniflora TaxID=39325 RepID=A0A7J7L506_9MAGN|nr:hypothetical protein GIB67_023621 [Kingdonia uniflora]
MVTTRDRLKQTKKKLVSPLTINRKPNLKKEDLEMGNSNERLTTLEMTVSALTSTVGELAEQLHLSNLAKASASTKRMISPSQSTPSSSNPSEPLPIPAEGAHEHSTTLGGGNSITLYLLFTAIKTLEEYVLPEAAKRNLMRSANNLWRNGKKTLRKKYDELDTDEARKKNCTKNTRPENWV